MQGKNKISLLLTLRKKGIPYEMIESVFADEDEQSEFRNALKWAQKLQPTIKERISADEEEDDEIQIDRSGLCGRRDR